MGTETTEIINPMQAPPPSAPAGSQRVRSRDSKGGSPVLAGSNYTDLPLPDRKIMSKHSNVELRSGHHNMLPRMTTGTAWEQHRQQQMLKGVYRTTLCDYEFRGCQEGSKCCFAHTTGNPREIDAEVMPLRFKVCRRLFDEGFSLPCEIRHEIGRMTDKDFEKEMRKKDLYQERIEERVANAAAERSQRPRVHDNFRSPRSSQSDRDSRTPDPNRNRGVTADYDEVARNKNKGKGKGDALALMEIDEDSSARQRDLTSGGADEDEGSDREEAVAPIDNNSKETTPLREEPMELSPRNDSEDIEPTPQLDGDVEDTDLTGGLPEVDV